jgi:hypothetical protein
LALQYDQHSKEERSKGKPKKSLKTKENQRKKKAIKALVKSKEEEAVKKSEKN